MVVLTRPVVYHRKCDARGRPASRALVVRRGFSCIGSMDPRGVVWQLSGSEPPFLCQIQHLAPLRSQSRPDSPGQILDCVAKTSTLRKPQKRKCALPQTLKPLKPLSIRLSPSQIQWLDARRADGINRSTAIRLLIAEAMQRDKA